MSEGFIVSFEGLDKCGKNTQLKKIYLLLDRNVKICSGFYSEPNDNAPMGSLIRKMLTHEMPVPGLLDFQRLFVLDRAQNLICFGSKTLNRNGVLLIERFAHSTLAYGMLEIPVQELIDLHYQILGSYMRWPDVTYLIDISPEEAMERLKRVHDSPQYFEKLESLKRIWANYRSLTGLSGVGNIVVIDGDQPEDRVTSDIVADLKSRLEKFYGHDIPI